MGVSRWWLNFHYWVNFSFKPKYFQGISVGRNTRLNQLYCLSGWKPAVTALPLEELISIAHNSFVIVAVSGCCRVDKNQIVTTCMCVCGGWGRKHQCTKCCDIFIVERGCFTRYNPLEGHPRGQFIVFYLPGATNWIPLNALTPSLTMVAVKSTSPSLKPVFGLSARGYSRNMVASVEDDKFHMDR